MAQKSPRAAVVATKQAPKTSPTPPPSRGSRSSGGPLSSGGLDKFFDITRRGSSIAQEVRGGLVTFFSMAYIIALNPIIIGTTPDVNGNLISGLPASDGANIGLTMAMVAAATALIAGILTIVMGVAGRFPVALAAGLGINAIAAYTLAPRMEWKSVMGLIVWEGIVITILVLTGFRQAVFKAVPQSLRTAISVGIGLFIALIGLVDAGFVSKPGGAGTTPLQLGRTGTLLGWPVLVFVVGLILVIFLYVRRVKGALLIGIIAMTVVAVIVQAIAKIGDSVSNPATGWSLNVPAMKTSDWALPNLELLKFWDHVSLTGAFSGGATAAVTALLTILALMLADFFDTMGTVVAIGKTGDLLDARGNPPHTQAIFLVDSVSAAVGGLGSVSSNTCYIESASGVSEGARTGFANIITGAAFLVAMFISPLVNAVPSEAVAPVLVIVGFLMMQQVVEIEWTDLELALPAFFIIALMPFSYSITVGIGVGFLVYVLTKIAKGKIREIKPLLWIIAALFLIYFLDGVLQKII